MACAAVSGLAAEARIAVRAGIAALASGGDAARTAANAERLIAGGATGLVSFGIAAGLAPRLAPGTLLLPRGVRDEAYALLPIDMAWRARVADGLRRRGLAFEEGDLLGAERILATADDKAALAHASGAVAADLESHIAARAAQRAGCAFIALRAVADPAARDLPRAALVPLDLAGKPRLGAVLAALLAEPAQLGALLRVAREASRALATLRRAVEALAE